MRALPIIFASLSRRASPPDVAPPHSVPHEERPVWLRVGTWHWLLGVALLAFALAGCTGRDVIGTAKGWTPVTVSDGVVYAASRDGSVQALDSKALDEDEDAEPVWEYRPPDERGLGSVFGPPAVGEEFVYVGGSFDDGDSGRLVALRKDRESSSRIEEGEWEVDLPGAIVGGPVLAPGLVLVGSEDGNLYAFNTKRPREGSEDPEPGERLWTFPTEGLTEDKDKRIWSTPVVVDGVVYFGAMDDFFYAVSLEEGLRANERLLWKFKTGGAIVTTPLVLDNMVIFGAFDRAFYALDANDNGRLLWSFKADNWFWAGPVTDGRRVFASSMDGKIYALPLDRRDGDEPEWVQDLGKPITATPFLALDSLVVVTEGGTISLVNTSDGEVEERPIELRKDVRAPLSGEGEDGAPRVYLGDQDGVVRSLDVDRWRVRWTFHTRK